MSGGFVGELRGFRSGMDAMLLAAAEAGQYALLLEKTATIGGSTVKSAGATSSGSDAVCPSPPSPRWRNGPNRPMRTRIGRLVSGSVPTSTEGYGICSSDWARCSRPGRPLAPR